MVLHRTEKARLELQPGTRQLGQKARGVLLLVDGRKTLQDLRPLFGGEGEQITIELVSQGYLTVGAVAAAAAKLAAPSARAAVPRLEPAPRLAAGAAGPVAAPPTGASDAFEGKRSLATTRMFLFDLCERMFVRRNPALATRVRDALREARDRESMLAVARDMLEEIERIAGPDRADSISERIAMLLPPEPSY